jgi:HPt (histidine-containing phosphotransfer) domain-containing protein
MPEIWDQIPPHLDATVLKTLASDTDLTILRDLLGSFVTEMAEQIQAINKALEDGDYETIAGIAHTMKGLGATFGANAMQDLMQRLETAASAQDASTVKELLSDIGSAMVETRESILKVVALIKEQNE